MIEVKAIIGKVKDGAGFIESMKDFGLENRLTAWQLGLIRLGEIWEIVRKVEGVRAETLIERVTGLFYTPLWGGEKPLATILTEQAESTNWETAIKYQIYRRFAELAVTGKLPFEESLLALCADEQFFPLWGVPCLKQLVMGLGKIEPTAPSVCLLPTEDEGLMELSLQPKGFSAAEFLFEVPRDLERLRQSPDEALRQKSIIAYSWLLDGRKKKTEKLLAELNLGPEDGARLTYLDPNEYLAEAEDGPHRRRVFLAAATAIPLAGVNVVRFLRFGKFPRVGILEMAAADFWR